MKSRTERIAYELPYEVLNDLRLRLLRNSKIVDKFQKWMVAGPIFWIVLAGFASFQVVSSRFGLSRIDISYLILCMYRYCLALKDIIWSK